MKIHQRILAFAAALLGCVSLHGQADELPEISDQTFRCLSEMTPVAGFFVDNLLGTVEDTVAVAASETGGRYPVGSVIQLVPGEVMVKHPEGTSPATNDWEFFELSVSAEESHIARRGFEDVVNRFGGNCLECHLLAEPQWDLVCGTGRGCAPLPLTRPMITAIQKTDPRCKQVPTLSDEEKQALGTLQRMLGSN